MTLRLTLATLALLNLTGCVAALPMATQLISGTDPTAQLCAMTKLPGQTGSLCDHMPFGLAGQRTATSGEQPYHNAVLDTAAR